MHLYNFKSLYEVILYLVTPSLDPVWYQHTTFASINHDMTSGIFDPFHHLSFVTRSWRQFGECRLMTFSNSTYVTWIT